MVLHNIQKKRHIERHHKDSIDENYRINLFFDKINIIGTNQCWEWQGTKYKGYGSFYNGKKMEKAHRFMWKLINGDLKLGLCVLHKCDNPSCVNPTHLFSGTNLDNIKDKIKKNRQTNGEQIALSKLNKESVRLIHNLLENGISQRIIAKQFNVSHSTIGSIGRRITWKQEHLNFKNRITDKKGINNPAAKIDNVIANKIKKDLNNYSRKEIQVKYNLSKSIIGRIARNET